MTLPNDVGMLMSNESLYQAAQDMRVHAATLITIAAAIETMTGEPPLWTTPVAPVPGKPTKAERAAIKVTYEQAADARIAAAGFEAAPLRGFGMPKGIGPADKYVFAPDPDDVDDEDEDVPEPGGWACEDHGHTDLVTLTSRAGRTYRSCRRCDKFEGARDDESEDSER